MGRGRFVVGIDGGGTKTLAVLADIEGNVLGTASGRRSNPQVVGFDTSSRVVLDLISGCCAKGSITPARLSATTVGLAGVGRESDRREFLRKIKALARKRGFPLRDFRIETDGRIALEGALAGEAGIVLISGTGSIGMAKDDSGSIHRVGGWGRTIGDEGSGFSIGQAALGAIAKQHDGRGPRTILSESVLRTLALSTPEALVRKVYQNKFDPSLLAPIVLKAAGKGDSVSKSILDHASEELVDHVRVLFEKLAKVRKSGSVNSRRIVLLGGLLSESNYLSNNLRGRLKSHFPTLAIHSPRFSPAYGAVLMGIQRLQ